MLSIFLHKDCIFVNPPVKSRDELFSFFAKKAAKKKLVADAEEFTQGLVDREAQGTTELKPGIAIPHAKMDGINEIFVMIAVFKKPLKFSSGFGRGVEVVFLIGAPKMDNRYIKVLGSIARLIEKESFIELAKKANVTEDIIFAIKEHSVSEAQSEEGVNRHQIVLSLNVKFSMKQVLAMFLELGISQPMLYKGEDLSAKSNFGFPSFGMGIMEMRGKTTENHTIVGISDDKDGAGKLFNLLKNEGIDITAPGAGSLYSVEIKHCFGGVNVDIDF